VAVALRRWPTITDMEAWLYGTARHMGIVYWRQRRRCPPVAFDTSVGGEPGVAFERQSLHDRLLDLARQCAKLPPQQRRLMFLRYRLGMGGTHR